MYLPAHFLALGCVGSIVIYLFIHMNAYKCIINQHAPHTMQLNPYIVCSKNETTKTCLATTCNKALYVNVPDYVVIVGCFVIIMQLTYTSIYNIYLYCYVLYNNPSLYRQPFEFLQCSLNATRNPAFSSRLHSMQFFPDHRHRILIAIIIIKTRFAANIAKGISRQSA